MSTAIQEAPVQEDQKNSVVETTGSLQLVSFNLGEETYGIEITKIREIILMGEITRVPQTPDYVKGLINLRSTVIPVIDLRLQFGLDEIEYTEKTCIIVVNVGREIGIIVDTVSEVLDIDSENIEPPPDVGGGTVDNNFILGMGKVGDAVKILLDIDNVLSGDEMAELTAQIGEESAANIAF